MCGICGILNTGRAEPVSAPLLRSMCSALAHRGPDGEGVYLNPDSSAGLGVRRLAVIDPGADSRPLSSEDGTVVAAANGEVYNFRELRLGLERKGHLFRTGTDLEVIPHLYEDHGIDLIGRLRGAFAFCLWDEREKKLFLARDRVGKKPLYYTLSGGKLLFASEIKALLKAPGIKREVDGPALYDYLTYRYVPHPRTAFVGIKKLPPAHYLICRGGELSVKRYWKPVFSSRPPAPEADYRARLEELFEESVRLRLASDVPLGAFLSGGLDSSIVVGVMAKLMKEPVKTFSIGFEEDGFSELKYARVAAARFGTRHREFVARPDLKSLLPELARHYDEPYADSSAVPCYCLSGMASREVTVALNGDGGDENFAGYPRHKAVRLSEYLNLLPAGLKRPLELLGGKIPERGPALRKAAVFLRTLGLPLPARHAAYACVYDNDMKGILLSEDFRASAGAGNSYDFLAELHELAACPDPLDRVLFADMLSYLPGDLLVKMDMAMMAHSMEGRSPFLDHEFIELASRIPSGLKLRGLNAKYILRKTYRDLVPPAVLGRRKMGFGAPVSLWLRGELREMFTDTVLSARALGRGYFNRDCLERLADEHMRGAADHGHRLWSLLMLELWHRELIDGRGGPRPSP